MENRMDTLLYFDNDDQRKDYCSNQVYLSFLDYAFEKCDYFMLVFVNYYGKGYSKQQKYFKTKLERFKIKSRTNPSWPGMPFTYSLNSTYKIVFYKTHPEAKKILSEVRCLSEWCRPNNPEDLSFFKGNECWFYSVGHEKIAAIVNADQDDVVFLRSNNLSNKYPIKLTQSDLINTFKEKIE